VCAGVRIGPVKDFEEMAQAWQNCADVNIKA
jgi:hypothetical protein